MPSVLITFVPHPSEVVRPGSHPPVLTSIVRRAELVEELGVDVFCALPFTLEFSQMPPDEFVHHALVERLHASAVIVGENFRFGHKAAGDVDAAGPARPPLRLHRARRAAGRRRATPRSSATYVRSCVQAGDMARAAAGAGPPAPRRRRRRARRPARPRARLPDGQPAHRRLGRRPADGVYAGRVVRLDEWGRTVPGPPLGAAAISVGTNPTFEVRQRRVEAFVLDFERRPVRRATSASSSSHRLRGMEKFDSVDALVTQMDADVVRTRDLMA